MRASKGLLTIAGAAALMGAAGLYARGRRVGIVQRHHPIGVFVETDLARLHVLEAGAGAPIMLLHGNAVTAQDWRSSGVFDALAETHRVIAPDRPGFGHSQRPRDLLWTPKRQAEAMAALLRARDAAPALIVAHSFGAQVALRLARDHPGVVKGLVLISGYYFPSPRLDSLLVSANAAPGLGDLLTHTITPVLGEAVSDIAMKALFAPDRPPRGYKESIFETNFLPAQIRAAAADGVHMAPEAARLQGEYGKIAAPLSILAGEADRIVDPDTQARRLARTIAHARLVLLRDAGHMLHHQNRNAVLEAVRALEAEPRI